MKPCADRRTTHTKHENGQTERRRLLVTVAFCDNFHLNTSSTKTSVGENNFGLNFGLNRSLNETQQNIIDLMIANPEVTAGQIAEVIGITQRQIETNISKLKSLEILERAGSRKSGRWVIKRRKALR